jgi:hypothetical protein
MRYLLPTILYIGLTAYVIADIAQHRDVEPYRLPKVLWVLIILFAPFVGATAWLIAKWTNRPTPGTGRYYPGPPDDDPEFRVWLNEQERRRRQERGDN